MDTKTTIALILIGLGFTFMVIAKYFGIDGDVSDGMKLLIATGIFALTGKDLYNKTNNTQTNNKT